MTAHVFIVDKDTFPVHLQYQFAGIGAKKYSDIDFNDSPFTGLNSKVEIILTKMMADISRIRKNDRILFYVQSKPGQEGKFFGIFRAAEDFAFIDEGAKYLYDELGKYLTFRTLFVPDKVYPQGVTEWNALDEIRSIDKPHKMMWSLIYRKLKGHRGCTMVTPYEEERICKLISDGQTPINNFASLDFDINARTIIASDKLSCHYQAEKIPFSLMPRMITKHNKGNLYEAFLQAEISRTIGRENDQLSKILLNDSKIVWLGNEIGCGVGMQSIDIMLAYEDPHYHVMPIELKSVPADAIHIKQIKRYVDWIEQYYLPNHSATIVPVLITRKSNTMFPNNFMSAVNKFNNEKSSKTCQDLRLVEFKITSSGIEYSLANI